MTDGIKLVNQMLDAFCNMDGNALERVLHEDARHAAPGSDFGSNLVGRSQITRYFSADVFPAFNQVKFEAVHMWEDQPHSVVVVEWRSHLWPKTGKNYSNTGLFVIEIKDGLIYWVREYFDTEKAHQHVND
jgi:ketosteroid isomerase-like protein